MDNPLETVESQRKWLENIHAENQRMTRLVENLLTLSRADTNQQTFEMTSFLLDEAVWAALIPFEPAAAVKEIVLKTCLEQGIRFCGDEKQIELIFSDTGMGIEEEHIGRLFDRFYRVTKAHSKGNDGSGLGLSIAKWVVEGHHGTMKVESTVGVGTSFFIILPKGR